MTWRFIRLKPGTLPGGFAPHPQGRRPLSLFPRRVGFQVTPHLGALSGGFLGHPKWVGVLSFGGDEKPKACGYSLTEPNPGAGGVHRSVQRVLGFILGGLWEPAGGFPLTEQVQGGRVFGSHMTWRSYGGLKPGMLPGGFKPPVHRVTVTTHWEPFQGGSLGPQRGFGGFYPLGDCRNQACGYSLTEPIHGEVLGHTMPRAFLPGLNRGRSRGGLEPHPQGGPHPRAPFRGYWGPIFGSLPPLGTSQKTLWDTLMGSGFHPQGGPPPRGGPFTGPRPKRGVGHHPREPILGGHSPKMGVQETPPLGSPSQGAALGQSKGFWGFYFGGRPKPKRGVFPHLTMSRGARFGSHYDWVLPGVKTRGAPGGFKPPAQGSLWGSGTPPTGIPFMGVQGSQMGWVFILWGLSKPAFSRVQVHHPLGALLMVASLGQPKGLGLPFWGTAQPSVWVSPPNQAPGPFWVHYDLAFLPGGLKPGRSRGGFKPQSQGGVSVHTHLGTPFLMGFTRSAQKGFLGFYPLGDAQPGWVSPKPKVHGAGFWVTLDGVLIGLKPGTLPGGLNPVHRV
ncbi:uncharacterized protein LOC119570452 [Penaeus monodon]|uniref:uncharacterized protein LOC119570452 n=1 Tax=Penaeus monodon TaxID=6687 RepID=UPI0018A7B7D5|nr:uncharacterized protein LOC119570452 [Penaeus monodon]